MQRPRIELIFHYYPAQEAELLADTLRDDFDVTCRHIVLPYPLSFIEFALGAMAVAVGTIAIKKFVELVVEDLYKASKRFLKTLKLRKGQPQKLKFSFELEGVRFVGEVTSDKKKDFSQAFETLGKLFEIAEKIVSSNRLPRDIVLKELYPKDDTQGRVLYGSRQLPKELELVWVHFDPELTLWKVKRIDLESFGTFVIQE